MILLPLRSKALALRLVEPQSEDEEDGPIDIRRPVTRGDCVDGIRPCPFVSCKYHLYIDIFGNGLLEHRGGRSRVKMNFPEMEVHQMTESCALDVADRGGVSLDECSAVMNIVRERVRQLEVIALAKVADFITDKEIEFEDAPEIDDRDPELAMMKRNLKGACSG